MEDKEGNLPHRGTRERGAMHTKEKVTAQGKWSSRKGYGREQGGGGQKEESSCRRGGQIRGERMKQRGAGGEGNGWYQRWRAGKKQHLGDLGFYISILMPICGGKGGKETTRKEQRERMHANTHLGLL